MPDESAYHSLLSVLAHEYTHGTLSHIILNLYEKLKNERSASIIAGVTEGLAKMADIYNHSRYGTETQTLSKEEVEHVYDATADMAFMKSLRCSREQEYQADIVAFRFLDWIGVKGEACIEMLRNLDDAVMIDYSDSDHPSTSARVELLEYMCTQKRIIYSQ